MYFSDIIGHEKVIGNLTNLVKTHKVGHAYIFTGAEGTGKLKTAKAFASALMCEQFHMDSCGECKNCHLTFGDAHPDLKIVDYSVDSDGKIKASISVDAIRDFKSDVYLKPFYSGRKIYIFDNADKLTVEAQNALLKIFEEPPEYITVILICHNISKILSTIISRAVLVKFPVLKPEELEIYLDKYYNNTDNKKIHSRISNGSVLAMIKNIEDETSLSFRNDILESLIYFLKTPVGSSFNGLYSIFMKNKDKKKEIIDYISVFVFDCLLCKIGNIDDITNADKLTDIRSLCRDITIPEIEVIESILVKMNKNLTGNANYKLTVLDSLIKIKEEIHG